MRDSRVGQNFHQKLESIATVGRASCVKEMSIAAQLNIYGKGSTVHCAGQGLANHFVAASLWLGT
jgi:hypothetical protein